MNTLDVTADLLAIEYGAASDALLLDRYVIHRDETAFATLVERYRQLVLRICRRVLGNHHDVEDAAQDTFLALASGAASIENPGSLASWLYGVAARTACKLAAKRGKRREQALVEDVAAAGDEWAIATQYMQQLLDEEMEHLPPRYRDSLILHYLMGKTAKEVAAQLETTVGSVNGYLKRGKRELRIRLAMRGAGLAVSLGAVHAAEGALQERTRRQSEKSS